MENWKPILGYEGFYEVSDLGRVRSVDRFVNTAIRHSDTAHRRGRVLKQNVKRSGYMAVDLAAHGKTKTIAVHRLVAMAFLPKDEGRPQVNHKNCNKADNRAVNLEWCTPEENRAHAKQNSLYNNPNKKAVRCKQTNMVFESSYKAAEWVNENRFKNSKQVRGMAAKIRASVLGMQDTAYGYTWERV